MDYETGKAIEQIIAKQEELEKKIDFVVNYIKQADEEQKKAGGKQ